MSFELDSFEREVLMHLHEMGYYNVTPLKLKEFTKDLKKLMKHDRYEKKVVVSKIPGAENTTSSTLPDTTDESMLPSSPTPLTVHRKQRSHYHSGEAYSKNLEDVSCSSSESSSVMPTRRVLRDCIKHAVQKAQDTENVLKDKPVENFRVPPKPSKSCDCLWRRFGCKSCDEKDQQLRKTAKLKENLAPPRPKSSFIKTWQLSNHSRPGSASHRSDPVALYHEYQQFWSQQKLPGENKHNDLRWTIRERMLGQDPHPRPLSQASSVTSISKQRKRL